VGLLRGQGLDEASATATARQLTERDALKAHLSIELGIDEEELANPWIAAASSALAFAAGAVAPLVSILLLPASTRIPVTFMAVLVALLATGWGSAYLGDAPKRRAIVRLVLGGAIAMAVTFGIGYLFGVATG
jgi:vacuolar iron transporter family protein